MEEDFFKVGQYDGKVVADFYMDGKRSDIYIDLEKIEDWSFLPPDEQTKAQNLIAFVDNDEGFF